ncbi:MAG: aminotransferase class I/II-fold pyridoxal phosphate-dependent enzyme [Victivallaceae bacterium]
MTDKLAFEGGPATRSKALPPQFIGANLIGEEEKKLVSEAIDNQSLFRHYGKRKPHFADDFENEFAEFIGSKYVLGTATGSGAYFCAAKALGIGPGDEVIIPAFGWITDYNMVEFCGATPVIAEINTSMNLSPESFERCITKKTKAVIVIHYQGAASRLDEIVGIAHRHNIIVIEDVAQACGGSFNGHKLGSFGDVACFSLQNNKVITSGDGGIFITNDQKIYELAVRYHDLGLLRPKFEEKLEVPVITEPVCGLQWRMGEMAAAVALAQLRKLPWITEQCRRNSRRLKNSFRDEFPGLKFRDVKDEDDIGIVVIFDLLNKANVEFFRKCIEAEGLVYGPTSGCQPFSRLAPVAADLKRRNYWPEALKHAEKLDARTAKLAILPVYTERDVADIAAGTIKILKVMQERNMLKF